MTLVFNHDSGHGKGLPKTFQHSIVRGFHSVFFLHDYLDLLTYQTGRAGNTFLPKPVFSCSGKGAQKRFSSECVAVIVEIIDIFYI
jgi:hypothetical protein